MLLSIVFIILELLAVTSVLDMGGLNPFWRLSLVFKCFTDTIILDDFKTALDKLSHYKQHQMGARQVVWSGTEELQDRPASDSANVSPSVLRTESTKVDIIHLENTCDLELGTEARLTRTDLDIQAV